MHKMELSLFTNGRPW